MASAVSTRTGKAITAITYPPTASILKTFINSILQMIIEINKLQREIIGTIKVARYKSVKCVDATPSAILFTKVIHFPKAEPIEWLEQQLLSRGNTLKEIHHTSLTLVRQKRLLQVYIKKNQQGKTAYLTTKYMQGWNLADILLQRQQNSFLNEPEKLKSLIFEIIGVLIAGKGFSNLIITNEVLFLEKVNESTYKARVNYLSLAGFRLLKHEIDIDKEEYLQIAMFLDEEAFETSQIDRFKFKARNLACLILSLLCRRNPQDFIFQNCPLDSVITKQIARQLHREVVQPRIKQLLSFSSLKKRIDQLKITDLHAFLMRAFGCLDQTMNWSGIQSMMLREKWKSSPIFDQLASLLWESQGSASRKELERKGLQCQSSPQVYLAMKLNASSQFQHNQWQYLIENSEHTRINRQMFFQALKYLLQLDEQTLAQNIPLIRNLSQLLLKNNIKIQDKPVKFLTVQEDILLQYPHT